MISNKNIFSNNATKQFSMQEISPLWMRFVGGKTIILLLVAIQLIFSSCEDEITPTLEEAPAIVAIDAWINNKPEPQVINVARTQPFFDNSLPPGVSGAIVQVIDENSKVFDFIETAAGEYTWTPAEGETFGEIGLQYGLNIEVDGVTYNALSELNPVPPVDSITFTFEEADGPFPEGFFAEFWARDLLGAGDTYWIRTFKNGVFQGKPDEINIAFDAGFSSGGNIDNIIFIAPIRFGVNSFEEDENGDLLAPFLPGDSIFVELNSITNEAFFFLSEVEIQTDRPGGFAELFATPLSNVPTNIISSDESEEVVGFFNVSAVSGNGMRLVE